jgi:hypothetical protein
MQKKEKTNKYNLNINFIYVFFILFLFSFFVGGKPVLASTTINFSPGSGLYMIGETVKVKVVIASDISVNAVSAKIKFSTSTLSLTSISKTGSAVSLWAQEPTFSNSDGTASLDGVILNGYSGSGGLVATLIFKAKSIGTASLSFDSASVYANDGSGTDVASGKGESSLTIIQNKNIVPPPPITKSDTNIVVLEVKDNSVNFSENKFSITASRPVKDNIYYIQIDALPPVIWIDDGTHIYPASNLTQGEHSIKVMAVDTSLNVLNGFLNFSTQVLKVPALTYYLKDIYPDELMILKGVADPLTDVEITLTNKNTGEVIKDHVQTNDDGNFTYVSENPLAVGTYSITARSDIDDNMYSDFMPPVTIVNNNHLFNIFITRINSYLTILTPLLALIILLIFLILYGIYRIKKFRLRLKKKLLEAENSLAKDFKILEEDADKENIILQKTRENKPLGEGENSFMDKFKGDIETTVGNLDKEVKDLDK